MRDHPSATALLAWYDLHARDMPWRVPPHSKKNGERPDPYQVWLSEIMLQQTTVAAVGPYFRKFTQTWPTVTALAHADDADVMAAWAGLGYYARARNLLKCARVVAFELGGVFPKNYHHLLTLPGVGPYTAAAIAAIAYDHAETVVDGNVERVMARVFAIEEPMPSSKRTLAEAAARLTPKARPGDYAQAVMDLGATICTPKSPACGICPWMDPCEARKMGIAAELPKRLPKAAKPVRFGHAYLARRTDGAWLLERRPSKGLLGGMLGWPGSDWSDAPNPAPPFVAMWREVGEVRHTFTHFHLKLRVHTTSVSVPDHADHGTWVPVAEFRPSDLPTLMRKAYDLGAATLETN